MKKPQDRVAFPMLPVRGLLALFLMVLAGQALAVSGTDCVQEQEALIRAGLERDRKSGNVEEIRQRELRDENENGSIAWRIAGFRKITKGK